MGRPLLLLAALLFGATALAGLSLSGASWSDTSAMPVMVTAAADWTPPDVTVSVPANVSGTATVTATAADQRSSIASVSLEYAPTGSSAWTALTTGCTPSSGFSPLTYSCSWATTSVDDSTYRVRAKAVDAAGFAATATPAVTTIANAGNVVLGTVPSLVSGSVPLTATYGGAVTPTTRLYVDYLSGSTWVQVPGCYGQGSGALSCTLDTTILPNGTATLRARAESSGVVRTDQRAGIVVDNDSPTATLTVPTGILSGPITLGATASDPTTSVTAVRFEYQRQGAGTWTTCGTDSSAPYTCDLATGALPDDTYLFRATATDAAGHQTTTATQSRTLANAPATIAISNPASGATLTGTVPVTATASSPRGIASVTIQVRPSGGTYTNLCTVTAAPYTCSWSTVPLYGAYQVRAVLDETTGGTVASAAVAVSLQNVVGSVAVTAPTAGSTIRGAVPVTATATSTAGVTSVRLETRQASGAFTTLCTASAAPYTCSWNTAAISYGSYEVRAVMTQGDGSQLTSATVPVTVDNRPFNGGDIDAAPATSGNGPSVGDQLVFTFSGLVNLSTIKPGFTGASTPVSVTLSAAPTGNASDVLTFPGTNLGSVNTGTKAIKAGTANFSGSTMTSTQVTVNGAPVTRVVVTLGSATYDQTGSGSLGQGATLTWAPSGAVTNLAGVACATAVVSESTGADLDF